MSENLQELLLDKREELCSCFRIISEHSQHRAGHCLTVDFLDTSHHLEHVITTIETPSFELLEMKVTSKSVSIKRPSNAFILLEHLKLKA